MKPIAPGSITIVGGGLAGLGLGLGLRRAGVPVILHEAGDWPRHRVCGEFLAGLDSPTVEALGLGEFLGDAVPNRSIVWWRQGAVVRRDALPTPAPGLSRLALDARLAEALRRRGAAVFPRSRQGVPGAGQGRPGLVWAAGRPPRPQSPWLGLKQHVAGLDLTADLELHFGHRAYCGLSRVEGGAVNVCGLFWRRADVRAPREELLLAYLRAVGLGALAERLTAPTARLDPASACAIAAFEFAPAPAHAPHDRVLLGDQWGVIPPFTGHGMTMALQSAALALPLLRDWARAGGRTETWPATVAGVHQRLRATFARRLAVARLLHPFLLQPWGQILLAAASRAHSLPFGLLYRLTHA